ncbi:MAG: hypothetical protein K0R73_780 [Candidatus Midichloriaceae bacterium]|jgi:ankyrin repeat protein|nr:hypothetical protein [Candidatus Midichloriaceae bacterium]
MTTLLDRLEELLKDPLKVSSEAFLLLAIATDLSIGAIKLNEPYKNEPTLLHWAVKTNFNELIEHLISAYGKDIDFSITDSEGRTALDLARSLDNNKALEMIVAAAPQETTTVYTSSLPGYLSLNTDIDLNQNNALVKQTPEVKEVLGD